MQQAVIGWLEEQAELGDAAAQNLVGMSAIPVPTSANNMRDRYMQT